MSDLVAFLTARYDEDEAAARDAYYEGQRWITEEEGVYRYPDDELVHMADRKRDARHIARWDPARVLREAEAKRKILAEHAPVAVVARVGSRDSRGCRSCLTYRDGWQEDWSPDSWPCDTVRALAAVYSDHPDYDKDWA